MFRSQRITGASAGHLTQRESINAVTLIAATVLYIAVFQNDALWQLAVPGAQRPWIWSDAMRIATLAAILVAGTFSVAAALCVGRFLKLGLILLVLIAVVCNYFMSRYGVLIDLQMLVNATKTSAREAGELMTTALALRVLLLGGIPAALILMLPVRRNSAASELLSRTGAAALLWAIAASLLMANYKEASLWAREHSEVRKYPNPVYPLAAAVKLMRGSLIASASAAELQRVAHKVQARSPGGRRRVVVMVVGETARADHFSLYGYDRDTNPQLSAISTVLKFDDVRSCGTSTAISVPCMFSRQGHAGFDRNTVATSENLLDILVRAGISTLWRDNNTGCQGVCARVETEAPPKLQDAGHCADGECYDAVLLSGLRQRIDSATGDQLIVLHQLGSHGPSYYKRHPAAFAKFVPECDLDDAYLCQSDALVNSYDNSILYTDHLLAQLIGILSGVSPDVDTAMLYVSDHGESLGENGIYLHGFPYAIAPAAQTHVPMLAWFSPGYSASLKLSAPCLATRARNKLSHDNLFDILLGLFDVTTDVYRPAADIIGQCEVSS